MIQYLFLLVGLITIAFAIVAVHEKNLLHSAIFLMFVLIAVAALFIILGAQYLGAIQILVYVGAVITLLLFTIMLSGGEESEE
ncbi:MAG: NADH-quinone oxidoreductase subunit J family protein [Thermoplasmata archaeon]